MPMRIRTTDSCKLPLRPRLFVRHHQAWVLGVQVDNHANDGDGDSGNGNDDVDDDNYNYTADGGDGAHGDNDDGL